MKKEFVKLLVAGSVVAFGIVGCATKSQPAPAAAAPVKSFKVEGVHFANDSAVLSPSANTTLNEAAAGMKAAPNVKWEIAGYTSSPGSDAHNLKLSDRRAAAVAKALQARGVPAASMTTRGFGEANPVADNSTKEGQAKNRRVEIRPIQ